MFASGLMGQKLWEKRQGITAEAEEKKDIRTRQQHLEDLGYPSYDPMKEPMEAWGPEVKKVGEKYYGEPTPKPILGRQGGLLGHEYKGAMLKPAIPKEKEQWSDIHEGPGGTWLRKNLKTGKTEQVIGRPPKEKTTDKWGTPYEGPEGSWLVKNLTTGKPEKLLGRPPTEKTPKSEKEKYLKDAANLYKYHIGQYNQASRGVGQFMEDPNKARIAKESLERALTIAIQHKKGGGNPSDLGITAESIREQFNAENLTKEKAVALLQLLFGME